jgi:hypothetical protein
MSYVLSTTTLSTLYTVCIVAEIDAVFSNGMLKTPMTALYSNLGKPPCDVAQVSFRNIHKAPIPHDVG